ncbi:MAG: hypothetical protein AAGB13_02840 [Cyanobacteria bacterium P01_F01_bin.33]
MVGFIKRLFSGGNQSGGAFYLEPDDAKTYGNIDYMRSERTVKRTFPKMGDSEKGGEFVQRVSALNAEETSEAPTTRSTTSTSSFQASSFQNAAAQASESKPASSSSSGAGMDMFRNMAKDIRKKK